MAVGEAHAFLYTGAVYGRMRHVSWCGVSEVSCGWEGAGDICTWLVGAWREADARWLSHMSRRERAAAAIGTDVACVAEGQATPASELRAAAAEQVAPSER